MTPRRAAAPAKVNLTLAVSERRADGYHDLSTILVRVGLADRLTARPTGAGATTTLDADRLVATGLPAGPVADNLVLRALVALRRHLDRPASPLDVALEKVVPVAAGLGGGSSDAAAAIAIASRAWGVTLDRAARLEVAAAVGSDVPFFALGAPAAWATGRGERLAALPAPAGAPACVLAVGASTVSPRRPSSRRSTGRAPLPAAPRPGRPRPPPSAWPATSAPASPRPTWSVARTSSVTRMTCGAGWRPCGRTWTSCARAWRRARGGRGCSPVPGRPSSLCMLPSRRHVARSRTWTRGRPAGATVCG